MTYVVAGHLTAKSDVYSFGVVLLELLTGRKAMDKTRPNGEHNLVEWARPIFGDRRRFYKLMDPRLQGHYSIRAAQKAIHIAAHCLSHEPKARPLMTEVVEALRPLFELNDMAISSPSFHAMQASKQAHTTQSSGFSRTCSSSRSLPNSPFCPHYPFPSPSPKGGRT